MKIHALLLLCLLQCSLHSVEAPGKLTISSDSVDYVNDQMAFEGHVKIEHPLGKLCADKAFVKDPWKGEKLHGCTAPGSVRLMADESGGTCRLDTPDGKEITATRIDIETEDHKITIDGPRGEMTISRGNSVAPQTLKFSAGSLTWTEPFHSMVLRNDIIFNQGDIGTLIADEEVEILESVEGDKRILRKIISRGKTLLTYTGEGATHTLTAYDTVCVDHERMQVVLTSPNTLQVHFKDNFGEFFADRVEVEYEILNYRMRPTALILTGHVHVRNQFASVASPQNPLVQYAIADRIHYSPITGEMVLSANQGARVLFYDKLNNIQVSAPALKMKRDPKTNQDSIKGEGDVRFTFVKHELNQLQAYFEKDSIREKTTE